jgi:hypothetical protein
MPQLSGATRSSNMSAVISRDFEALNVSHAKNEAMYTEIITDAFTKDVRNVSNHCVLSVPFVSGSKGAIARQSLSDAVEDGITETAAMNALMNVLAKSDCALVQELRVALAKKYVDQWACELAEYTA